MQEVTPTKRGAQQETYRIRQWQREPLATWSLPTVTSVDIAEWMEEREAEGKAPSTIGNAMNTLSAVYGRAKTRWGYNVDNPLIGLQRPKARKARWVTLSKEDEARLLDVCASGPPWLIWCVRLALATAMRASEIRYLRWPNIYPQSHIHLDKTKNGEERDVPLLAAGKAVVSEMRSKFPHRLDGWVFGDPENGGITKDMLSQAFRDAARKANVGITCHDLRHVATTRLAPLHRDALHLASTTGHKTINQLKRYYNPAPEENAADLQAREAEWEKQQARRKQSKGKK